jgi:drug/metabolite transporter (DMT)-like permease
MTARNKAILALIIANIIWGGASPIFKWSLTSIPPFALAILRFGLAGIILFPFVHQKIDSIKRQDYFKIILFSLSGVTVNISFFFWGLKLAPAINAAVLAATGPLILLLLGWFFLKEKVEKIETLGTLISFAGVLIIILSPILGNGYQAEPAIVGNLFLFLAVLGAVGQGFFGKQLFQKNDPLPLTFLSFFIGTLTFFPLFLFELWQNPGWLSQLQFPGVVGIFYGVIFSSTVAYSLFNFGLSKIEASEAGIYTYLMPITSIIIAVPFFEEKITRPFILGSLLVFLGIIAAEKRLPLLQKQERKDRI